MTTINFHSREMPHCQLHILILVLVTCHMGENQVCEHFEIEILGIDEEEAAQCTESSGASARLLSDPLSSGDSGSTGARLPVYKYAQIS